MNKEWILAEIVAIMGSSSCPASIGLGDRFTMVRRGNVFACGDREQRRVPEETVLRECSHGALKFALQWLLERRLSQIKRNIAVLGSEQAATAAKLRMIYKEEELSS